MDQEIKLFSGMETEKCILLIIRDVELQKVLFQSDLHLGQVFQELPANIKYEEYVAEYVRTKKITFPSKSLRIYVTPKKLIKN